MLRRVATFICYRRLIRFERFISFKAPALPGVADFLHRSLVGRFINPLTYSA